MRWIVLGLLLFATPALATDYYVRTDGSDSNTGLVNSAGGAWATVGKCGTTLVAGDRCLIQAGTYTVSGAITSANGGAALNGGVGYNYGCSFTYGSTTVPCSVAPTAITAGMWVRADDRGVNPYFSYTRVASVVGTTITLDEAYRGTSEGVGPLATGILAANFVEYRGVGSVILRAVSSTSKPTFVQDGTYSRVWHYTKSGSSAPWNNPKGFRENPASPDWYSGPRLGIDNYILQTAGSGCICGRPTCAGQVDGVPGSWCDDGTQIHLQMMDGGNPNTASTLEAGYVSGSGSFWTATSKSYFAIRNIRIDTADPVNGVSSNYNIYPAISLASDSNRTYGLLIEDLTLHGGLPDINLGGGCTECDFRGNRFYNSMLMTSQSATHSGLRFYDHWVRGGNWTNIWSVNGLVGASATDKVRIQRAFMYLPFTQYYSSTCNGQSTYWNCDTRNWGSKGPLAGGHGPEFGNGSDWYVANLLVENSIFETTSDGFNLFWRSSDPANGIVVRSNTFGVSGTIQDNFRPEIFRFGNIPAGGGNAGSMTAYNNLYYADAATAGYLQGALVNYNSSWSGVVSDYNAFVYPWESNPLAGVYIWNGSPQDLRLPDVRSTWNQETNSIMVCYSGCTTSGNPGVFNDTLSRTGYFVKPTITGGVSNYTPTKDNKIVNAGLLAQCPSEDFYGNPRNDGQCDIGAVELQGGVEPAGPHRTDILPGTKLR